jgi:peptidyl-tRNA hydrolase, PTH1 family
MSAIRKLFSGFRSRGRGGSEGADSDRGPISWVVAGLGNPGKKYAHSRHNSGFRVLDRIAETARVEFGKLRFGGVTARAEIAGASAMLVKPETFYNASGDCVAGVLGYFKVPVAGLIVVHDELDLDEGRIQIKLGGGDAGNRGVRSIIESLGSREFVRVRIGVGHPAQVADDKEYLLRPMGRAELDTARDAVERATEAVRCIVAEGVESAMGRYNRRS